MSTPISKQPIDSDWVVLREKRSEEGTTEILPPLPLSDLITPRFDPDEKGPINPSRITSSSSQEEQCIQRPNPRVDQDTPQISLDFEDTQSFPPNCMDVIKEAGKNLFSSLGCFPSKEKQ